MTNTPPRLSPEIQEQLWTLAVKWFPESLERTQRSRKLAEAAYRLHASDVQQLKAKVQELHASNGKDKAGAQTAMRILVDKLESAEAQLAEAHARLRELEQALHQMKGVLEEARKTATWLDVQGGLGYAKHEALREVIALTNAALSPAPAVPPQESDVVGHQEGRNKPKGEE